MINHQSTAAWAKPRRTIRNDGNLKGCTVLGSNAVNETKSLITFDLVCGHVVHFDKKWKPKNGEPLWCTRCRQMQPQSNPADE